MVRHHKRKRTRELTRTENANYHVKRLELVKQLGGKCVFCGVSYEIRHLEFDHKHKRQWVARKLCRGQRLIMYRKEAEAGLIQLACRTCNAQKGIPGARELKATHEPKRP